MESLSSTGVDRCLRKDAILVLPLAANCPCSIHTVNQPASHTFSSSSSSVSFLLRDKLVSVTQQSLLGTPQKAERVHDRLPAPASINATSSSRNSPAGELHVRHLDRY